MRLKGRYFFSPKDEFKDLDLNNFATIIEGFERRIRGWYFEPLQKLLEDESSLFVASAVECMLADTLSGFFYGLEKETNREDFIAFLEYALDFSNAISRAFYERFRCGILHQTYIKEKSCISTELEIDALYLDDNDSLFFNPRIFFKLLSKFFTSYLNELQNDINTQIKFRKHFKFLFNKEYSLGEWTPWDNQTAALTKSLSIKNKTSKTERAQS